MHTNVCPFALRLVVTATDRGSPRLAGSATLTVIITDLNDNSPMIPLPQEIHVPESKLALATGWLDSKRKLLFSPRFSFILLFYAYRYSDRHSHHPGDRK